MATKFSDTSYHFTPGEPAPGVFIDVHRSRNSTEFYLKIRIDHNDHNITLLLNREQLDAFVGTLNNCLMAALDFEEELLMREKQRQAAKEGEAVK